MTREEWKLHWRQIRLSRPKVALSYGWIGRALKACYNYIYTEEQNVFIRLTNRYYDQLSYESRLRNKRRIHSWMPEARARSKEVMKNLVYSKNPFLSMVPKSAVEWGGFFTIPVIFGKDGKES